jgi:starch-binding outer membrane protein, SusD/RagB family
MKNSILKIIAQVFIGCVFVLFFAGCVNLDETPKDFTSPDNFYQNVGQVEAAFASSMNRLFGGWTFYDWMGNTEYVYSDDQLNGGDLDFGDATGNGCWTVHYRAITDINPAIKALNEDQLGNAATQEEKDQLMAQARFLRAFNYFTLVRLYGDIPIIDENTDAVNGEISRAPVADVYAFIESDLIFATQYLPEAWPEGQEGRPGTDAARTLLAKVYITMATAPMNDESKFESARDMAQQVINNPAATHGLLDSVSEVFELYNMWSKEMLWSFHTATNTYCIEPQIWLPGSMADGWGDLMCDRAWVEAYPEQPRKHAYLLLENWDGVPWTEWDEQTAAVRKYLYDSRENLENYVNYTNFPILRYPDVLLLFAEAENKVNNGPDQAAVDAVNQVIDRANGYVDNPSYPLLTTAMTEDEFDEAVIQERNLELCFEYDRWFDLVRKRILYDKTIPDYQPNFSEDDYLLPIPEADLRINPAMTQNPGYTDPTP